MSTRSRIGVILSEGEVRSIYCHYDGYPTGVGAKLRDKWRNPGRVNELIALGDLSVLGSILGARHDFDTHSATMRENGTDWCLFYDRDRGEQDVAAVRHGVTEWPDYGQEYEYLFDPKDRSWVCRAVSFRDGRDDWTPLSTAIAEDEAEQAAWRAKQNV